MDELLLKVKNALGITSTVQDDTLKVYIDGMKDYMKSAGVPSEVVGDKMSYGAIVAGVTDTWNYGGGEIKLSPYTKERIIQLKFAKPENNNQNDASESNDSDEGQ
ncbi:MAG: hypothetical protein IJP71_02985 [Lachnospiraceae bacterium]|nr:hypothetical protein [Lachnospiraceae bacterium]